MKKKANKKIFVLDTNVLLHDHNSIYKFEENDIVLPITVLEEIDKFKIGNDTINFNAREFTRELDKITSEKDELIEKGISLGKHLGKLSIISINEFSDKMKRSFPDKTKDHMILSVAENYHNSKTNESVVFVSKDINLRVKARSIGLKAQDYKNDKVENTDFMKKENILKVDNDVVDQLYKSNVIPTSIKSGENQYYILKSDKNSGLAKYSNNTLTRIEKNKCFGITPRNAEQTFALDCILNKDIQLVALTGKAGTGKTLITLAGALQQHKKFLQIMMARPIVSLSNKDLGYLPGDVNEKIGPYMLPLFDNLGVIKHSLGKTSKDIRVIENMQQEERLIISPLAYIRGRSLSNTFMIIDEAQNLTPHEIKTIITRAAEGTKLVFTGDIEQIDSPYLDEHSNGLSYLIEKMTGQEIFTHINLMKGERSFLSDLASKLL
jgi:PhoH-like ATPase